MIKPFIYGGKKNQISPFIRTYDNENTKSPVAHTITKHSRSPQSTHVRPPRASFGATTTTTLAPSNNYSSASVDTLQPSAASSLGIKPSGKARPRPHGPRGRIFPCTIQGLPSSNSMDIKSRGAKMVAVQHPTAYTRHHPR